MISSEFAAKDISALLEKKITEEVHGTAPDKFGLMCSQLFLFEQRLIVFLESFRALLTDGLAAVS